MIFLGEPLFQWEVCWGLLPIPQKHIGEWLKTGVPIPIGRRMILVKYVVLSKKYGMGPPCIGYSNTVYSNGKDDGKIGIR